MSEELPDSTENLIELLHQKDSDVGGIFVSKVLCDLDTKTEPLLKSMWPHP